MKTLLAVLRTILVLSFLGQRAWGAEAALEIFQRGLFEEEANRNPAAAVAAYQSVLDQLEEQRKLAATVLFRMGECYRKLGRTNEAVATYQKLVKEFPSQETLNTLAQQNLAGLGAAPTSTVASKSVDDPDQNEIARLQKMIQNSPDLVNGGANRVAPLSEAAASGKLRVAEFLIDHGANINATDKAISGGNPLNAAVFNGHKAMVELLLKRGANVNGDSGSKSALFLATELGYASVAEALVKHGADVNRKSIEEGHGPAGNANVTPLHIAVLQGHEPMVRFLIEHGADLDAQSTPRVDANNECGTPLHWAVDLGRHELLRLLLASGSNPNVVNTRGLTPLHRAAVKRDEEAVAALVKGKANINAKSTKPDEEGWTALHYAVQISDAATVKTLLQLGAEVDPVAVAGVSCPHFTPLLLSVMNSSVEIAKLLLEAKANVHFTNDCGMNALLYAIQYDSADLVQSLLEHGASPGVQHPDGFPALLFAQNISKLVELLLAHGADANGTDPNGRTILHGLVTRLRQTQPGLPPPARAGITTPPRRALRNPLAVPQPSSNTPMTREEAIRRLELQRVESNASPALAPLPAPEREILNLAQLLISKGADVNRRDNAGYTPLNIFGIPAKTQTDAQEALADLLRSHGAIDAAQEPMPDPDTIRLWRSSWVETVVVFKKDKQRWNRYTLFEALYWNASTPPFPDLAHVVIHRTTGATKTNIMVDLIDPTNGRIDCSKTVWLEFGDVVEVPEKEHALNVEWRSIEQALYQQLGACSYSRVTLNFKETALPKTLSPPGYLAMLLRSNDQDVSAFLTTSADLSRVQVRRMDPITGKQVEYLVNAVTAQDQADLWLRDGDVVLVPEKGQPTK